MTEQQKVHCYARVDRPYESVRDVLHRLQLASGAAAPVQVHSICDQRHVAGLPSELDPEGEDAKRFDLLMLNLQLAQLRSEPGFERLRDKVKSIAGLLEEKSAIPMVHENTRRTILDDPPI